MEIGVVAQSETPSPGDLDFTLGKGNRVIDNWNADKRTVYTDQVLSNTLTVGLRPHTLGPTGATWTVTQRPVSIESAALVVSETRTPITVRTAQWYQALSLPETDGTPTDLYYDPSWANGKLYFYPVPIAASTVELWVRIVLA